MNVRAAAVNLAGVAVNRANRFGRHTLRRVQRLWRGGQKAVAGRPFPAAQSRSWAGCGSEPTASAST